MSYSLDAIIKKTVWFLFLFIGVLMFLFFINNLITSACVRMFSVPSVGMTMYFIFLPCLLTALDQTFFYHAVFVLLIYAETVFYLCWSGKMYQSFYFMYLYCFVLYKIKEYIDKKKTHF